jgi:hypothetical protein
MALMPSKTYEVFLAAGAPEEKARGAAEEIAAYESRFAKIDTDLAILKWMIAGLDALGPPSIWPLLRVAPKVGALG